jgi:hypothetical protein
MGKSGGGKKGGGHNKGGGSQRASKTGGEADGRRGLERLSSAHGGKSRVGRANHRVVTAQFTAALREEGLQLAEVERDGARLSGVGVGSERG